MLIRQPERFTASEITDEKLYLGRRAFIAGCAEIGRASCRERV